MKRSKYVAPSQKVAYFSSSDEFCQPLVGSGTTEDSTMLARENLWDDDMWDDEAKKPSRGSVWSEW